MIASILARMRFRSRCSLNGYRDYGLIEWLSQCRAGGRGDKAVCNAGFNEATCGMTEYLNGVR